MHKTLYENLYLRQLTIKLEKLLKNLFEKIIDQIK